MKKFYIKSNTSPASVDRGTIAKHFNEKIIKAMRITIIFLTVLCLQVSASAFSQRISINQKNMPLEQVLKEIKRQTGYFFLYDTDLVQQNSKPVNINVKDAELKDVLSMALKSQPFNYEIKENTILIMSKTTVASISKAIDVSGKIVDENGTPMPGASIKVKGKSISMVSGADGTFTLRNVEENDVLVISYLGYADREVQAKAQLGTITLVQVANTLNDVVITGYTNYTKAQSAAASSLVAADKINQVPGLTLDQVLQGRVAGMSVTSSSGQPGQSASVVIRGIGSVNGSSTPLYVMDGIPIEAGYFQTINPEDIESATVLKDASAKALYGSRGSNGVIVFTTKKGREGKLAINYNSQYGFSNLSRPNFEMMNAEQRLRFEEEIGLETGRDIGPGWTYSSKNPDYITGNAAEKLFADYVIDSLRKSDTDWRDIFFQKGKFQEQQVSLSGGSEKLRFYNSLNYYKQEGVAKRTGLDRYALRSNLDFRDEKFSGSVNLSLGYSQSSFTEGEGSSSGGTSMSAIYYALPYEKPYAPDGTLIHYGNEDDYNILDQREGSAALERLLNSSDKTEQFKSIIGTSFAYQILPELKISTRAGIDYRNSTDQRYINPDSYYGTRKNSNTLGGKGRLADGSRRNFNVISTTGLTFAKTIAAKHDLEVSAFYEYVYNNYNSFGFVGFGIDGRLPETPAGITNGSSTFLPSVSGGKSSSALASFMGVARYTYDNKYTLTGSYRYDGSTKVAPQNKWHGFYSVGANWNVKAEEFLKSSNFISDLRVRASYGTTASPFGGDFLYLPTYAVNTSYGGVAGIRPTSPGNANFDWEYVDEFNVGFDISLFKSRRLRATVDYYNKITSNMFIDQPLSVTSGFETLSLSSGKMRNRGVEFDISGDVIKTNDFTWSIGVNAGYNKNEVLFVSDNLDSYENGSANIVKVSLPYGTYYAPKWGGVDPLTGSAQYYKRDGSLTTTYDFNNLAVTESGSFYPKLTGGFNTSINYKGFTASALFSFVSDVMRWNNEDFYNENQRYATSNQTVRMLEDRWKKPGDQTILQRFDDPRNFTSKDIQDASFLRLRNVTLGYNLPKSILEKTKFVKGVRLFVQGQNLFTWTKWRGLDPENNNEGGLFQYPSSRTYTAGLNVNF